MYRDPEMARGARDAREKEYSEIKSEMRKHNADRNQTASAICEYLPNFIYIIPLYFYTDYGPNSQLHSTRICTLLKSRKPVKMIGSR